MIDLGSLKFLSWLEMMIFLKMRAQNDPAYSSMNLVKFCKSLKSVEMVSIKFIMVILDVF